MIEDLGEYTEEKEEIVEAKTDLNEQEYLEQYGELLTTPDSVDDGAKLIQ